MILPDDKPLFGSLLAANQYSKGLVGFWPFREAGNLVDYSGNKKNGVITGPTWRGQGLIWTGTNGEKVDIPTAAGSTGDLTGQVTFIVRHKPTSATQLGSLIGRDNEQAWLYMNAGAYRLRINTSADDQNHTVGTGTNLVTLAMTFDDVSGEVAWYEDGVQVQLDTGEASNMVSSSNSWIIGEDPRDSSGIPYDGLIEYVALYNRALNASEIKDLFIDPWLPIHQSQAVRMAILSGVAAPAVGAVRLINGGLVNSGLIGGRLIA